LLAAESSLPSPSLLPGSHPCPMLASSFYSRLNLLLFTVLALVFACRLPFAPPSMIASFCARLSLCSPLSLLPSLSCALSLCLPICACTSLYARCFLCLPLSAGIHLPLRFWALCLAISRLSVLASLYSCISLWWPFPASLVSPAQGMPYGKNRRKPQNIRLLLVCSNDVTCSNESSCAMPGA
jgi:hypothetical protein